MALPLFFTSIFLMPDIVGGQVLGIGTIIGDFAIAWFIFNSLRDNETIIKSGVFTFKDWQYAAIMACVIVQGGFSILFLIGDIFKAVEIPILWALIMFTCPEGLLAGIIGIPSIIDFFLDDKKKEFAFKNRNNVIEINNNQENKKENTTSAIARSSIEEPPVPIRRRRD